MQNDERDSFRPREKNIGGDLPDWMGATPKDEARNNAKIPKWMRSPGAPSRTEFEETWEDRDEESWSADDDRPSNRENGSSERSKKHVPWYEQRKNAKKAAAALAKRRLDDQLRGDFDSSKGAGPDARPAEVPQRPGSPQAQRSDAQSTAGALALVAFVLAIVSILSSNFIGLIFGIVAVALANSAIKHDPQNKYARWGKTIGWLGIFISVIVSIMLVASGMSLINIVGTDGFDSIEKVIEKSDSSSASSSPNFSAKTDNSNTYSSSAEEADKQLVQSMAEDWFKESANPTEQDRQEMKATIEQWLGMDAATIKAAGVDEDEIVDWVFEDASWELSDVFVFEDDGTASIYYNVKSHNASSLLSEYQDIYNDYANQHGYSSEGKKAQLASQLEQAMNQMEPRESFISFEFTREGNTWTMSQDSMDSTYSSLYGNYTRYKE